MNMTEEQQKREKNNQEEWIEEQLGRKDQQVKVEKNWKKGNTRTTEMREIHSRITGAEEQYKRGIGQKNNARSTWGIGYLKKTETEEQDKDTKNIQD